MKLSLLSLLIWLTTKLLPIEQVMARLISNLSWQLTQMMLLLYFATK